MEWREVVVGHDYRGQPYTMGYFHLEEVLASMRTQPSLRDHWRTRSQPVHRTVQEPPCGKGPMGCHKHRGRSATKRVYHHPMDCRIGEDAERRMQAAGHTIADPRNVPVVLMTGEDKAKMTQFGGTFYPVHLRPGNLDYTVWTSEKACHLWALLPVYRANPKEAGKQTGFGDLQRLERLELHAACIAYLTKQLEVAALLGVRILEDGEHLCTLYPHAWGHADDRAETQMDTGTSCTYTVQCGCANCLVPRDRWAEVPDRDQGYAYWDTQTRYRAQHLQLADREIVLGDDNKTAGQYCTGALPMDAADPRVLRAEYDSYPPDSFHRDSNTKGYLINETLERLAKEGGTSTSYLQLEERFAAAPREKQEVLKHFWGGVGKVTNASHDELNGIWQQLLVYACLLVSGEDWQALLTWALATSKLDGGGPVSDWDFEEFYLLLRKCRKALRLSSYARATRVAEHKKTENVPWHDVVHVPRGIMWWGTRFSTAFFEQAHEFILKR